MARIVYGVSGEGSGHSSRAREMAGHLVAQGHIVRLVSYDRGYRNLKDSFDVFEIQGLHIGSRENRVSIPLTMSDNLKRFPEMRRRFPMLRRTLFEDFAPDAVITDFEPQTAWLAAYYKVPLISLDNQHRMRHMEHPCPAELEWDRFVTKTVIRALVPFPDVSLVTTFYFGKTKNDYTFLFPPILRRQVLDQVPERGEHLLVYVTEAYEELLDTLRRFTAQRFRVYGFKRTGDEGNLSFKPFSHDGFLEDLRTCKGIIATAGFTLTTESFYLRKPYFSLPMKGQFEQQLNALLLDQLGYGVNARRPDREAIESFLGRIPEFENRLAEYRAVDNLEITTKLDDLLVDGCALLQAFRRHRSDRSPFNRMTDPNRNPE